MPTTPRWALRYPALTDSADVPRDVGNLATDLDGVAMDLPQGLAAARPAALKAGRYFWSTDHKVLVRDNGAGWDDVGGVLPQGLLSARPVAARAGRFYYATDEAVVYLDYGTGWVAITPPVGHIMGIAYGVADPGYVLCDFAEYSRTTYAKLFAKIGTLYGVGNGTTTFNVPDGRGRTLVGVDGVAARLTANDALGNSGGTEKHTLLATESGMPAHTPTGSTASAGLHSHGFGANPVITNASAVGGAVGGNHNAYQQLLYVTADAGDHSHSVTINPVAAVNAVSAHNIMQPYFVGNWQIKSGLPT